MGRIEPEAMYDHGDTGTGRETTMTKLYLIGAGPGDPELLTLKALRILREVDVVLYDRLVSPEVLALVGARAERIDVGKHEGASDCAQERIITLILEHARAGRTVARLKSGDPGLFGRVAEEWLAAARAGVEVELVPGVSSALAAPELAGVPLTQRGVSHGVAIVSGHCAGTESVDWRDYARVDTLVILMGVKWRVEIARALVEAGRPAEEPVLFVERATTPPERVIEATLGRVAAGEVEVSAPAVFVTGAAVALRSRLSLPS
jgi:uroporphyrin-III C-methyltransferase